MPPHFLALPGRALLALALLLGPPALAQNPIDPPRGDLRLVIFGDFNGSYGALDYPPAVERAIEAITGRWRPDLLLSPGDVVAGQNRSLPGERFPAMWEVFDREIAEPLRAAGVPYGVAIGNHDGSSLQDGNGEFVFAREREAATRYWSQPMYDDNLDYFDRRRFPFDYAFRAWRSFIVVLDASSAFVTEDQREWLERVLTLPAARAADLRIVVGHLPLVPVSRGRDTFGEVLADPDVLQRIMEEAGVDMYVSGHHAAYYAGQLGDLELLFAGGVGARRLLAGDSPARSTVTLVDVWWEPRELRYTTFDLADMQIVSPASLPASIGRGRSEVRLSARAFPSAVETAQR